MSTAIQKAETAPVRMGRAVIIADALQQEGEQRKLLGEYVRSHMIEGTDYGVVPGTKNKTLLKPGAEKLTQLYRCTPRFTIEEKIENWDTGLFYYRFSCEIVTQADDAVVAEGVGSCSTYESRYRWRTADRACPSCGAAAIMRSKYPPKERPSEEPGWYCFAKKGGCGANFGAGDASITEQKTGRTQNPDILDCVNTVLKMAKKRALVDASIALARCSDIFTQDLDELVGSDSDSNHESPRQAPPKQSAPSRASQLVAAARATKSRADLTPVIDTITEHWNEFTDTEREHLNAAILEMKAAHKGKPSQPPLTDTERADLDSKDLFDNSREVPH